MSVIVLIMLLIGLIILATSTILAYLISKRKKDGRYEEFDYRTFFILGICFLPMGVPLFITTGNPGLMGLTVIGIIYLAIGLKNRDKWKTT